MKIINLGILAHVDAGKTTLTESLLYTSGAIAELGSVDKGTTRTDTMNLERQRGITIQTAVTSFQWEDVKSQHYRYARPYGFFGGSIPFPYTVPQVSASALTSSPVSWISPHDFVTYFWRVRCTR